ncbi:hypothetical protein ACGVWS_06635 [Enterobacteriaceae bacterium LUAb1]
MSDLEQLQQNLASTLTENRVLLDPRTVRELLNSVAEYTRRVPFTGHSDASWELFWMNSSTPDKLYAIYQNVLLAKQKLPVQQAFLLTLLHLLETPKRLLNTLPARHRSLYYHDLLGFAPQEAQSDRVAVNFTLQKNADPYPLPVGSLLNAGQDSAGNPLTYQTDDRLLITRQQLTQVCWIRQDNEGHWQRCTALDSDNNIALPAEGLRLFTAINNETPLMTCIRCSVPLAMMPGERTITLRRETDSTDLSPLPALGWLEQERYSSLSAEQCSDRYSRYRLTGPVLPDTTLALQFPAGQPVAQSVLLQVAIDNCPQLGYRAQEGDGHLEAFSYPFGIKPGAGDAFEMSLPAVMLQQGGTLTIEPQWCDLPAMRFSRWYANYPAAPQSNGDFTVQLYLTTPQGKCTLGEPQPLFLGEDKPQMSPLRALLPADSSLAANTEVTLTVALSGPGFLHAEWHNDHLNKNPPWTPQVSRIDTHFQQTFTLTEVAGIPPIPAPEKALYLGFSEVSAQETLSVYWSLRASSALTLSWWYYNQQEQWVSLTAAVQDKTAGLSVSNLWQVALPDDIRPGGEGFATDTYWIKAIPAVDSTIAEPAVPVLRAIWTNAMTATLNRETAIDEAHFITPLPAETIRQLVSPVATVQVSQPLPSAGGRPQETEKALLQRVAARIRHRQRAVTWEDMRNLLTAHYPQIFDVRVPGEDTFRPRPASGVQQMVVIPDRRYCDNDDALRPILSEGRLSMMAHWLGQYTSVWALPALINPTYVEVRAYYQVVFTSGMQAEYGHRQLVSQLQQIYMPWGSDKRRAVIPGTQLDYYQLLATIQQSPLVQRVLSLKLVRQDSDGKAEQQTITASDTEVLILCPEAQSLTGARNV